MSLYGASVKRPIMTTLCFVTVIILGLFSLAKLPIDLYPDIDTNTLMVITMYPGASAEDIEQNRGLDIMYIHGIQGWWIQRKVKATSMEHIL